MENKKARRRAQIRRAQIQHRQRKVEYIDHLELSIAQLRDMICHTQQEAAIIRAENEAMKMALAASNITDIYATSKAQAEPTGPPDYAATDASSISDPLSSTETLKESEISNLESTDEKMVTLAFNETVGTPCFTISSNSPLVHTTSAVDPREQRVLSPEQEQAAINFILG